MAEAKGARRLARRYGELEVLADGGGALIPLETAKKAKSAAHAEFSASGSGRWLNCPGSIALSKKAPEQPESKYAAEGTEAHKCHEELLQGFLDDGLAGFKSALEKAKATYSEDKVEHATDSVRYILQRFQDCDDGSLLMCEMKVDASPFTCAGQFGTLDAAIVEHFGRLIVFDFKYGAGVAVDPEGYGGAGNSQLVYYALGISHLFDHNFSEVELVVIQPRAYHPSGTTIRSHTLTIEQLLDWQRIFRQGVSDARAPNAPLAAGPWCRFCPAGVICPELKEGSLRRAQIAYSDEHGVESVPEPRLIKTPNLGRMLDACDQLEAWIDKVRAHAAHVLERGGQVDGYKLVPKRASRKWANAATAKEEAALKFGARALKEPQLLSPAQFEKAVVGAEAERFMAEHVVCESSGTTMVREGDSRPAAARARAVATADEFPDDLD